MGSTVTFVGDRLKVNSEVAVYSLEDFDAPMHRLELDRWLSRAEAVQKINNNKPRYLYILKLKNAGPQNTVLLEISGTIADEIELYAYDENEMVYFDVNGYFYPRENQSYIFEIPLAKGQLYQLALVFKSRYFSGPVNIFLENPDDYHERSSDFLAMVYVCLGGMIFLGLYNLLLYVGVKDTSYFYYSIYLFCTVLGWASVFAVLVKHFDVNDVGYALLPFYLGQMFSVLFYIRFLNLTVESHPNLLRLSYAVVFIDLLYLGIFPWMDDYYIYYKSLMNISSVWLLITLFSGVYRLWQGFIPARFFVLGFSMIAIGGVVSILPGLGIDTGIESFYMVTLICQTLDMLFLAIALADRINLLRKDKEKAQSYAHQKDIEILDVEQKANQALIESNLMLKEALDISEAESHKKQSFLMMASHELKTPLNAMVATANDVAKGFKGGEIIRKGVERLALVVDEVTLFSQLSAGELKTVRNSVDVGSLILEIADSQKVFSDDLDFSIVGPIKDVVETDRYLLGMILKSLIDNACKYSEFGVVRVTYSYDVDNQMAEFKIEDNGQGIELDEISRLMQPFEQDSQGYSREKEGMGLGLYVVKRALEELNGEIEFLHSKDLEGALVIIRIPAKQLEVNRSESLVVNTALVVEDNPVNAVVLTSILDKLSIKSDVVENGEEALSIIKDNHYDVIFMDLQMPVMDGFEATRQLTLQAYPSPIVAVTANSESGARERCLSLGMADIILKPVRISDIKTCLAKL